MFAHVAFQSYARYLCYVAIQLNCQITDNMETDKLSFICTVGTMYVPYSEIKFYNKMLSGTNEVPGCLAFGVSTFQFLCQTNHR